MLPHATQLTLSAWAGKAWPLAAIVLADGFSQHAASLKQWTCNVSGGC